MLEIKQSMNQGNLTKISELLVASTATDDYLNDLQQSPLMLAVLKNNLLYSTRFLEAGFSPSQQDQTQLSPFIAAAANGFDELFEIQLDYHPDLTQVNRFGGTALLPSSEKGHLRVVQTAIDAGVPINHVNRLGWSALLEAVVLGDGGFLYQDIINELMHQGALSEEKDFEGNSALDYARELKQEQIQPLLKSPRKFTKVYQLIRAKDYQTALRLLLKQPPSNQSLYYQGYVLEQLKRYDEATALYKKGLETAPEFAFYLANLMRKTAKTDEAIAYFEEGAKRTTGYFFTYHLTNYLRELGRHEAAITLTDELLREYPDRVDFMFHKANSLRSLNRHQEAYEVMVLASKKVPNNPLFEEHAQQSQVLDKLKEA